MLLSRVLMIALSLLTGSHSPNAAGGNIEGIESINKTIKSDLKGIAAAFFAGVLLVSVFIMSLIALANIFHNMMLTVENGAAYETILFSALLIISGSTLYYLLREQPEDKPVSVERIEPNSMSHILPRSASSFVTGFMSAFTTHPNQISTKDI